MKHLFITILLLLPLCRMLAQEREYVIVVHGGAGAMENLEDDKEKSTLYYAALDSALSIGNAILSAGSAAFSCLYRAVKIIRYFSPYSCHSTTQEYFSFNPSKLIPVK